MSVPEEPRCEHVGRVLQSYVDGELGPSDAERVADHLVHCERCGIELATVERVVGLIRQQRPDLDVSALGRLERFVDELDRTGGDR
jgi:anti-sigma factor RsiW